MRKGHVEHELSTTQTALITGGAALPSGAHDLPGAHDRLEPGTHIDRYEVISLLGEGSMGRVYRARDTDLGREVALKRINPGQLGIAQAQIRLHREAQAMALVEHPAVVRIYDVGVARGQLFVAMELARGGTLAEWAKLRRRGWREVLGVFIEAGRGLAAAHQAGLVHRDIKPGNILLDAQGRAKVSDFGLARMFNDEYAELAREPPSAPNLDDSITRTGTLTGTLPYMAPEQLTGGAIDARADQFAFCVALWEALCGRRPFQIIQPGTASPEVFLRGIRAGTVDEPRDAAVVPRKVLALVRRGLSADRKQRWTSMDELVNALARAARPRVLGWLAGPVLIDPAAERRRRRWRLGIAAVVAVVLVVLAFSTQRYLAQRELDAAVTAELITSREALGEARDAERNAAEVTTRAFAAFDAVHWEDGERLWRQVIGYREPAERAYRKALRHAEIAFAKDPARTDVTDTLGDILLGRAGLADRRYDIEQRDELIERLALYDADGSRRARWNAPGRVAIHAPAGAAITLESGRSLGVGSADVQLPAGSYVVAVAMFGRVTVRAPILVERGGQLALDITPPEVADVPAGFVYIPAGEFLYGNFSEEDRLGYFVTTPQRRRSTPAFLIGATEVTFGDWLAYVDALPPGERERRVPGMPTKVSGGVTVARSGAGRWRIELALDSRRYVADWGQPIAYTGRERQAFQDWRRMPVLGVSADDAIAYAGWLDRTGRVPGARLCSEVEWERAARGADGRAYPGGHPLEPEDANTDLSHRYELMGPDEVGSHPASRSPFGLDDMAGNALEWTVSEEPGYTLRGGSYQHDRKTAHTTNRAPLNASMRDASVGVRLCASAPPAR